MKLIRLYRKDGENTYTKWYKSNKGGISKMTLGDVSKADPVLAWGMAASLDFSDFSAAKKFKVLDYWPEIGISETELDGRTRLAKSTPEFSIGALTEFNRKLLEHQKMQRLKK